jgi:hypothetical protein
MTTPRVATIAAVAEHRYEARVVFVRIQATFLFVMAPPNPVRDYRIPVKWRTGTGRIACSG